ncbi:MAG: non-canonical purine NTP pyrophosphatase [Psychrilyobacter sp.]|uniref:non-canonical purine NTP pyrophosphatase n=1 Tax=Psychrilyobacter sp. TaxID=2586924 RepID=UPI003C754F36
MKQILYGTRNDAKVKQIKEALNGMDIEIIGLNDINKKIPKVIEDGKTPLENAKKKAESYFQEFKIPIFSCDSGLYFEGVKDVDQPGVYIRRVKGIELSDDEMIEYYSNIAKKNGGEIISRYENAIYLKIDENTSFKYQGPEISFDKFIISEKPYDLKIKGFPLDSLSKNIITNKYYLEEKKTDEQENRMYKGIRKFFKESFKHTI